MKVLVIRFGAMGDLIHVSPSLTRLKAQYPEAEIHVLTSAAYSDLVHALAPVQNVWTWDKADGIFALWAMAGSLRAMHFDAVINLHSSLKTHVLCMLLGTQVGTYRKQKCALTGMAQRGQPRLHAVEDFYRVFQSIFPLPMADRQRLVPSINLMPTPAIQGGGDDQELPISNRTGNKIAKHSVIGLIPGVGALRPNRAWPIGSWQRLIASLQTRYPDHKIVLVGGPEDQSLAQQLVQVGVDNQCGQQSILDSARLLASCEVVVGGDTGPLHLAAATGVPVLGLFAPTSVVRTGPLGQTRTITPAQTLSCWPCEKPVCETGSCMTDISVEAVLENIGMIIEVAGQGLHKDR